MATYRILRSFSNHDGSEPVEGMTGLTLEEAQAHCRDPQSHSKECTTAEGVALTAEKGPWFDFYESE